MNDEQALNPPQLEGSQEVDRIRDIIFGGQMREYQQRFETVQRDLDRLQQELDRLTEQLADQDSDQGKKLQALRRELRQADDDLRSELREGIHKLADDKVNRADLGQLFIELGNYFKTGVKVTGLLETLLEPKQDAEPKG
jgi:chromosome segregation ATPase